MPNIFNIITSTAIILAAASVAAETQRQLGEGCLRFNPDGMNIRGLDDLSPYNSSPIFYVPITIINSGEDFEISARFEKIFTGAWAAVVNDDQRYNESCKLETETLGLLPIVDSDEDECTIPSFTRVYYPVNVEPELRSVAIRCARKSDRACSMRYILPNDWVAIIALPQNRLSTWADVALQVRSYFDTNFLECGADQ